MIRLDGSSYAVSQLLGRRKKKRSPVTSNAQKKAVHKGGLPRLHKLTVKHASGAKSTHHVLIRPKNTGTGTSARPPLTHEVNRRLDQLQSTGTAIGKTLQQLGINALSPALSKLNALRQALSPLIGKAAPNTPAGKASGSAGGAAAGGSKTPAKTPPSGKPSAGGAPKLSKPPMSGGGGGGTPKAAPPDTSPNAAAQALAYDKATPANDDAGNQYVREPNGSIARDTDGNRLVRNDDGTLRAETNLGVTDDAGDALIRDKDGNLVLSADGNPQVQDPETGSVTDAYFDPGNVDAIEVRDMYATDASADALDAGGNDLTSAEAMSSDNANELALLSEAGGMDNAFGADDGFTGGADDGSDASLSTNDGLDEGGYEGFQGGEASYEGGGGGSWDETLLEYEDARGSSKSR